MLRLDETCFACKTVDGENGYKQECLATRDGKCDRCAFYKTRNQFEAGLVLHNGSKDINRICREYAEKYAEKMGLKKQMLCDGEEA